MLNFLKTKASTVSIDYLLIMPWNLKEEIIAQMGHIRDWCGQFVTLIPKVTVYS